MTADRPKEDQEKINVLKMKEDLSLNLIEDEEFPGVLAVRANLFAIPPPKRIELDATQLQQT